MSTKQRRAYDCAHCGALFKTTSDHMIHVVTEHEPRVATNERRPHLLRPWHCWTCRRDVPQEHEACTCGEPRPSYRNPKP